MKRKKKYRKKSNTIRIISIVLALALIMHGFSTVIFEDKGTKTKVMAANADNGGQYDDLSENWYVAQDKTANIQTMADLVRYSQAYYSHAANHYQDTITLNITGQNAELTNFYGLGTEAYPFEGKIVINSGTGFDFRLPEAFFDHVSDRAKIVNENEQPAALKISRIGGDNSGEPVFAKHVHSSGNSAGTPVNWKVEIVSYIEALDEGGTEERNYNFAGIIGEMQAGANVQLDVIDNSSAKIYANGVTKDVGYICGTIKSGAKLTVNSVTGSNSSYTITATDGDAGGIVGSMENGSTLTLGCSMLNTTPTVSATGNAKYAGGLVGRNAGGTVSYTTTKPYAVGGTVSGKAGAGGLFGYYRPVYAQTTVDDATVYTYTYDISDYSVSTIVNGNGSVGGLFGVFENKCVISENTDNSTNPPTVTYNFGDGNVVFTSTDNNKRTVTINHSGGDVGNIGGFIGYYTSNSMSSTLKFDNVISKMTRSGGKFTAGYGGAIGRIANTSYVLFDGFELEQATYPSGEEGSVFGGLVGDAGNSFIDTNATADRSISISSDSFKGGGLVGSFEDGVLRLRGATDISRTTCADGGQIVAKRDDTLIFAEDGWELTRKATPDEYDDIGSWGEVIRFGTDLTQSDVFTVGSDNRITIEAPVTTIDSEEDFAIDAICFSIKVGSTNTATEESPVYDGNPWLKYAIGATLDHTSIVTTDLELEADIDLRKTGLTGLTRDNGTDKVTYSGEFDGNGYEITLAIGDTSTGFNEKIYRHDKNGLFGILSGGSVTETKFAGAVNVKAYSDMYIGAAAAQSTGNFSATDVNVSTVFKADGSSNIVLGRLAGLVTANGAADTNFSITNNSGYGDYTGNISGANSGASSIFGGVIGEISSSVDSAKTWTISNVKLTTVADDDDHAGKIENISSKDKQQIGGLVAVISNSNANKVTLTLADIALDGVKLKEMATKTAGGLLGYNWTNTNVNVNSVTVTNGKITLGVLGAADFGGIIYNASGKWTIPANGLKMDGAEIDAPNAGSFGMIVNHGGSLYLLLTATNSFDCDGAALTNLKSDIVFDELVAYSVNYGTDNAGNKLYADEDGDPYILKNGNGIVSIKTNNLNMSGSVASGTYQPQTSRGSYLNKWTRYYYNLDTITGAVSPNAPQKLMIWGLNKYAHEDLKTFFNASNTFNSDSNVYDMTGYSWYPVDVGSDVMIRGTFKFANNEFETCEGKNTTTRSSLSQTQHYMMHEGLFRNVTDATVTVRNTTWQGTISRLNTPYKTSEYGTGALIFDTINGSKKATAKVDSSSGNIILDGIKVCNATLSADGAYAPLMINKIGDYTKLSLKHIWVKDTGTAPALDCNYNSNGSTIHAATSLIGNAGLSSSASNINFEFGNIKLDGRSSHSLTGLDSVYPTLHSIFTKATLLNQFMYSSDSDATYNYSWAEDWENASTHASGTANGVTYGSELSDDTDRNQWYGEEFWYNDETHDASGKLTSPESGALTGGEASKYDFSGFIPYVAVASTKANLNTEKKHQIRVNHSSAKLSGCGTYNDPYMITQGDLEKIAKVINGDDLTAATFNLPILMHDVEDILTAYESGADLASVKWDTYGDQPYKYNGTVFKTFTGDESNPAYSGTGYSAQEVRTYLAGAYYKLNADVELSTDFTGLGATGDGYAVFRGVIIGSGEGKNTITNKSAKPLIAASHGSVVKNLNIKIDNTTIAPSKLDIEEYRSSQSNEAYGAVIGQIFGGDNIIDNVKVQFNETTVNAETGEETVTAKGIITVGGDNSYLVPVGGYVGVVVNGALIFRGMEVYRGTADIAGLTNDNVTDSSNANNMLDSTKYLYVNPIVGRVLNGYVLTETTTYRPYETGTRTFPDTSTDSVGGAVTMKNGTKNYSIPDIDTSDTSSIIVGSYSSAKSGTDYQKTTVTLLDGQAVFLLGALIQSQATKSKPANPFTLVSGASYGSDTYKTTHVGTYERIGEQNTAGTAAPASGHPYNDAVNDGWDTSAKPYVAGKYTSGGVLAVTNRYSICNIQLGPDSQESATIFKVPDGFKGLGSYLTNDNYISLFGLDGQGNTVSLDMSLQYYKGLISSPSPNSTDIRTSINLDNYTPLEDDTGFGLFNYLRQNISGTGFGASDWIENLNISGKVYAQVYTDSDFLGYAFIRGDRIYGHNIVSVGGLAGTAGNNHSDTIRIKNVSLNNLEVFGPKTSGGLIGCINCKDKVDTTKVYNCSSTWLKVSAGQQVGGLVGIVESSFNNVDNNLITIDGAYNTTDTNSSLIIDSVNILSNLTGGTKCGSSDYDRNQNRTFYAGGIIGRCRNTATINNMTIGERSSTYTGFIGNSDRTNDTLNEKSPNGEKYNNQKKIIGDEMVSDIYSPGKPWSIIGGVIGGTGTTASNGTTTTAINNNCNIKVKNCNVYNINMYGGFVGGISGRPEYKAEINNCTVSSTQTTANMENSETTDGRSKYLISGWYAVGGIIGETRNQNSVDGCSVYNYVIRCYSEKNGDAKADAGGFMGRSFNSASYIRNSSVVNCFIEGRGKSNNDKGIGGLVGLNGAGINGYNVLIKDIKLLVNYTSTMDTTTDTPFPYTTITTGDYSIYNGYVGGICDSTIKFVGFSLKINDSTNETIKSPWGKAPTGDNLTDSFFINADYMGACDDEETRSVEFSNIGLANADPKNNVKDFINNNVPMTNNKPYVTSSPFKNINGTQVLTGDGIYGTGYNDSIAKQIIVDAIGDKPTGYYQDIKLSFPYSISKDEPGSYALASKPSGDTLTTMMEAFPDLYNDENGVIAEANYPTYGEIYLSELQSKLTTFQTATERGTSVPSNYDFPVLVLDDTNRYATTELLNNYIRVLTNTDYNYAATSDNYVVRFGKCTYQTSGAKQGTFEVSWSDDSSNPSNLKIVDEYFKLSGDYDNGIAAGQFTLVDVQFKIPEKVSKVVSASDYAKNNYIAYHLYIPVLVKKMLNYDFECSVLSGTNYRVQPYAYELLNNVLIEKRNNVLIENLETPVTLQFSWVYRRTLEEWVRQIEGGESLLQTFDNKKITVNEHNRSAFNISGLGFPDTDMVLVDANNDNKPYYATKSMAYNDGILNLASFTTDGTGGGTAYSPVQFVNYFDISVSDTEILGDNVVKCMSLGANPAGATIKVDDTYYRPYTEEDTEAASYLTFNFKKGMYNIYNEGEEDEYSYLKEDYYISFFTKKATGLEEGQEDTSVYHLVFSAPQTLGNIMPNKSNTLGSSDLFLGDIYSNTFSMTENNPTEYELTTASTSFGATFYADIALSNNSKNLIKGYLGNSSVSIYQSFLINFNKTSLGNNTLYSEKGVKSQPSVTVSKYVIDTENASGLGIAKVGDADGGVDVTSIVKSDSDCEISVENGTITSNYIELRNNQNLANYLKNANGAIRIKAEFTLDYTGENEADTKKKISDQFPLRDRTTALPAGIEYEDIGTIIVGSSGISPSNTDTAFSKEADSEDGTTMYFTGLKSGVVMSYESDDAANINGTYAQLGINARNSSDTELPMKTLITYNVANVEHAEDATRMDLTLKMYRKDDYEGSPLPLEQYIDHLIVKDKNLDAVPMTTDNSTSYVYSINEPMDTLDFNEDTMTYFIPIDFSVFTGANSGFEGAKDNNEELFKYYSNYMVMAEVVLYIDDTAMGASYADDHIIYSNAKIITDWVTGD